MGFLTGDSPWVKLLSNMNDMANMYCRPDDNSCFTVEACNTLYANFPKLPDIPIECDGTYGTCSVGKYILIISTSCIAHVSTKQGTQGAEMSRKIGHCSDEF